MPLKITYSAAAVFALLAAAGTSSAALCGAKTDNTDVDTTTDGDTGSDADSDTSSFGSMGAAGRFLASRARTGVEKSISMGIDFSARVRSNYQKQKDAQKVIESATEELREALKSERSTYKKQEEKRNSILAAKSEDGASQQALKKVQAELHKFTTNHAATAKKLIETLPATAKTLIETLLKDENVREQKKLVNETPKEIRTKQAECDALPAPRIPGFPGLFSPKAEARNKCYKEVKEKKESLVNAMFGLTAYEAITRAEWEKKKKELGELEPNTLAELQKVVDGKNKWNMGKMWRYEVKERATLLEKIEEKESLVSKAKDAHQICEDALKWVLNLTDLELVNTIVTEEAAKKELEEKMFSVLTYKTVRKTVEEMLSRTKLQVLENDLKTLETEREEQYKKVKAAWRKEIQAGKNFNALPLFKA